MDKRAVLPGRVQRGDSEGRLFPRRIRLCPFALPGICASHRCAALLQIAFSDPQKPSSLLNHGALVWDAAALTPRQQTFAPGRVHAQSCQLRVTNAADGVMTIAGPKERVKVRFTCCAQLKEDARAEQRGDCLRFPRAAFAEQ